MPWIHLDDLAALLLEAATNESWRGVFNAASPGPVRNADFTATLARALHRPAILPVPAFLLRAVLGEFSRELLGSRRVLPRRVLDAGFQFRFSALESALAEIVRA
jgi:NAD dependent epimerase/dehydratase family enzyme